MPGKTPKQAASTAIVSADPLQAYLAEVKLHPMLTPEEERELAVNLQTTGDREAAYLLVVSNLRLVVKIAMDYHRQWIVSLTDIIQEGNIGLMEAVKKFDPYKGVKLSSYASYWIKAYIIKYIMDNFRLVKIGTTQAQRKLFFNLKKEKNRLDQMGFVPETKLLAERLDVTERDVIEMGQRMDSRDLSLDVDIEPNSGLTHKDLLVSEGYSAEEKLADAELMDIFNEKLKEFRKQLDNRDKYILDQRILARDPKTFQQIGEKYNISRERARQIEEKIIRKLREYISEEIPDLESLDFEF